MSPSVWILLLPVLLVVTGIALAAAKEADCRDTASWCRKLGGRLPLSRCYRKESKCCATCRRLRLSVPDCPYGDRSGDCGSVGVERPVSDCYDQKATCCHTCHLHASGIPDCPYGDRLSICSNIGTRYSVSSCYEYGNKCCDTCGRFQKPIPGCPYGDRLAWCVSIGDFFSVAHCKTSGDTCCETCHRLSQTTTTTTTTTTTIATTSETTSPVEFLLPSTSSGRLTVKKTAMATPVPLQWESNPTAKSSPLPSPPSSASTTPAGGTWTHRQRLPPEENHADFNTSSWNDTTNSENRNASEHHRVRHEHSHGGRRPPGGHNAPVNATILPPGGHNAPVNATKRPFIGHSAPVNATSVGDVKHVAGASDNRPEEMAHSPEISPGAPLVDGSDSDTTLIDASDSDTWVAANLSGNMTADSEESTKDKSHKLVKPVDENMATKKLDLSQDFRGVLAESPGAACSLVTATLVITLPFTILTLFMLSRYSLMSCV